MNQASRLLGVLGGMGPLATVDFLQKLIEETPATRDQDHVPVIAWSVPQIPERPPAIVGNGVSPLPQMLDGVRTLQRAGVHTIAIACNTAHYWFDALVAQGGVPMLHIADAACAELSAGFSGAQRVGLLATDGTIAAGFYQSRLKARGFDCMLCDDATQRNLVRPAIDCVKRNEPGQAHALALRAARQLLDRGAQTLLIGCTELPLALEYQASDIMPRTIDATRALARACVRWWRTG